MYAPSHRAPRSRVSGRHIAAPQPHSIDTGRRDLLKSSLAVATVGAAGIWIAEPAAAAQPGMRMQLDKRSYAPGEIARLRIREDVDYRRRMLVSGPHGLKWHKVDGGRNYSVFAAKVKTSGTITVQMNNRITDVRQDTAQIDLSVLGTEAREVAGAAPFVAYSATSFFKSRVDSAPIDSAATAAFRSFMKSHPDQRSTAYPTIRGTGGNPWGMPFAMGTSTDPRWRITGAIPSQVSRLSSEGFPAPDWFGSTLTGTSDSPMVIIDRAAGRTIWAAKAKMAGSRTVQVGVAGYFEHTSNGLDQRNPRSDNKTNYRSRGCIPEAMVIRKDLVDYAIATGGDLGHVLHMFLVETSSAAGFCHPMVGAESGKNGFGAEGLRLAIAPDVDVTSRGMSPEGVVVARTLQMRGCYLGDNSGSGSGIKAEQESSGHSVWGGRMPRDVLRGLTWNDFVVLPKGWQ